MNLDMMHKASRLITAETFYPQDYLVNECLTNGLFEYEDIINYAYNVNYSYKEISNPNLLQPIHSWIPTSSFFANLLVKYDAPVLRNTCGNWWGRTAKGLIFQDPIIVQIIKDLEA